MPMYVRPGNPASILALCCTRGAAQTQLENRHYSGNLQRIMSFSEPQVASHSDSF